jgi:hypothetical protein
MIDYIMGPSSAGVYTMSKTFMVENSKDGWKNDMDANMVMNFARGVFQRSSLLGNLKPQTLG